ncbi:Xenotropic and polytropic retrovirus receptor 1 [Pleosporales sp. CAS-2024a]
MKFAKELERDRTGKKKLKAIHRALRTVHQTPRFRRRGTNAFEPSPFDAAPKYTYINRNYSQGAATLGPRDLDDLRALAILNSQNGPREPLAKAPGFRRGGTSYGSIVGTPPEDDASTGRGRPPPSLKLPGAALDPDRPSPHVGPSAASLRTTNAISALPPAAPEPDTETDNAFEVGKTVTPAKKHSSLPARYRSVFKPMRMNSDAGPITQTKSRPSVRRLFSMHSKTPPDSPGDVPLEAYRDLDLRQAEFFAFLDLELDKIEAFYKEKEEEATHRLAVLRDQLHIMRDRRIDEIIHRQTAKIKAKNKKNGIVAPLLGHSHANSSGDENSDDAKTNAKSMNPSWLNPIDAALDAINAGKYGHSTKEIAQLATPTALGAKEYQEGRSDFVRRPDFPEVPYQSAKRKLKTALQEYYRGLELLKSYALLNRTAFRKINKKYDKIVNARPSSRYMTEKVNNAWFVNSDVIEGHIRAVEDLYARYFERGNHKVAVGKLRIKIARAGDYTDNTFRNGILLASGIILGMQGVVKATHLATLSHPDWDALNANTSYLLQIYGGYFLANFLLLLFCLVCRIWHETKINYVFIFEYDTRHFLDWRQLAELPCWCLFFLGLFVFLNFSQVGGPDMFLYYPVILIAISVAMLFNPLKIFHFRTRMWLLYSLWRLLLAGVYPVEWRDFYLGDMFCSLTYTMGNIATFFCLYSRGWNDPGSCNSSHLRVVGFLSALPGIWRALQCLRRYADTRNKFPHLLNFGKYIATIMFYATLSIYRIDQRPPTHAAFITFATINSIYTSFWDIYYDWSLGDPHATHPFLRKELGYKRIWWYYTAMLIDPILRFNWILYTSIPLQLQHSAVTSFGVSLSEICRRGMWSLFRVENEHCTNVGRFRASRDVPLPYEIPPSPHITPPRVDEEQPRTPTASLTGAQIQLERTRSSARPRHSNLNDDDFRATPLQRAITTVGDMLRDAHAEDFERKRKPELGRDPRHTKVEEDTDSEDEDEGESMERDSDGDAGLEDNEQESALSRIREDVEVGMSSGVISR